MKATTHVHLDFHNSGLIENIGQDFNAQDFAQTLKDAAVSSITCFAKCHHGYLYYDTKLPEQHPHLARPILDEQYQVLREQGIQMPIYISVGFDEVQAYAHPDWIAIDADGKQIKEFGTNPFDAGWHWLCLNTDYKDKILEVVDDLANHFASIDGFFFDIVTQPNCCCHKCKTAMLAEGIDFTDTTARATFARNVEQRFKEEVVKKIKEQNPTSTIFFNGLVWDNITTIDANVYTHLEIESLASGLWGYEHYPLVVKSLAHYDLETVAMTARFHKSWADFGGYKTEAALEYEVLRGAFMSGAISIGDQMHPLGFLDNKAYQLIGEVNKKALPVLKAVADTTPFVEVGIVFDALQENAKIDQPAVHGASIICRELHVPYNLVSLHEPEYWSQYKLLIFPDSIHITGEMEKSLAQYLSQGGKIIATFKSFFIADEAGDRPSSLLPIRSAVPTSYEQDYIVVDNVSYIMYKSGMTCEAAEHTPFKRIQRQDPYFDRTYEHFSSHFQTPNELAIVGDDLFQNEGIIYLGHPYFSLYKENGNEIYQQVIADCLQELYTPTFTLDAPPSVHIETKQTARGLLVELLHYQPEKVHDIYTIKATEKLADVSLELQQEMNIDAVEHIAGSQIVYDKEQRIHIPILQGYSVFELVYK